MKNKHHNGDEEKNIEAINAAKRRLLELEPLEFFVSYYGSFVSFFLES